MAEFPTNRQLENAHRLIQELQAEIVQTRLAVQTFLTHLTTHLKNDLRETPRERQYIRQLITDAYFEIYPDQSAYPYQFQSNDEKQAFLNKLFELIDKLHNDDSEGNQDTSSNIYYFIMGNILSGSTLSAPTRVNQPRQSSEQRTELRRRRNHEFSRENRTDIPENESDSEGDDASSQAQQNVPCYRRFFRGVKKILRKVRTLFKSCCPCFDSSYAPLS